MEEMKKLMKVWAIAIASLTYCYFVAIKIPKGIPRFLSLLPIFYTFTILPLTFSSIHLRGISAFCLTWLGNFKLLLFAFNQGPLIPHQHSYLRFLSTASLPIKSKDAPSPPNPHLLCFWPLFNTAIKALLLSLVIHLYRYKNQFHHNLLLALYCLHIYLALEVVLAVARALVAGMEVEPQFNEPYLSSSLQDFWGKRWNLMVTSILRPAVYDPIRRISTRRLGRMWSQMVGVGATFLVSGIMHELIFYYVTAVRPTWEVTWFFVLHGLCTATEVAAKRALTAKFRLPRVVSGFLTLGFVGLTGFWLFFPQIVRSGVDVKAIEEYTVLVELVEEKALLVRSWFWD